MHTIESHVRSWGRSIGVVIPKEIVVKEKLGEGDAVEFILFKKSNALKETFGRLKLKKTTI